MGAIPLWMTDPVTCAGFSLGEPVVSVEALINLRALLDSLPSTCSGGLDVEAEGPICHEAERGQDGDGSSS
jgi:hypothetical protein